MTALEEAKALLRMPKNETMTGYTPDGKSYFVVAGQWYSTPKAGDVIYFYSSSKGRVGHTGIVEKVDATAKIVHTIEGNTSSTEYAENGGCVARHSYSYKTIGGTNRVNGFGRPNFSAVGITAAEFIEKAKAELGYLEKRSNKDLDSKTANAGSNNFQKFQRDVQAGNGDQWCQYFVDAIALYTVKNKEKRYNETVQYEAVVNCEKLAVHKEPNKKSTLCSFSGIPRGATVGVCDYCINKYGNKWFYIQYNGKHGFCYYRNIKKKQRTADDITVHQFLKSCKNTMNAARSGGFRYGDSHATPPCSDKLISCDRLIARALYDLGFKDQRTGGETCGTLDAYLKNHGFIRSTKAADIKKGSILLVKHSGVNYISHAFVVVKFHAPTWNTQRYDAGSDERIQTPQPLKHVKWGYTRSIIVYNIP